MVSDIYFIVKNGKMDIDRDRDTIYLITCSKKYNDKQLIIKGVLVDNS